MPIERFWMLEKNVTRLQAEEDVRKLDVAAAAQSKDGYKELHERLLRSIGTVAVAAPKLDKEGLHRLKGLKQGLLR